MAGFPELFHFDAALDCAETDSDWFVDWDAYVDFRRCATPYQSSPASSEPSEEFSAVLDYSMHSTSHTTGSCSSSDCPRHAVNGSGASSPSAAESVSPVSYQAQDGQLANSPSSSSSVGTTPSCTCTPPPSQYPQYVVPGASPSPSSPPMSPSPSPADPDVPRVSGRAGRSRTVHNPELTHELRVIGSCLACKISHVPCDKNESCDQCRGKGYAAEMCMRKSPGKILAADPKYSRWSWKMEAFMPTRDQFSGPARVIFLSLRRQTRGEKCLEVVVQTYCYPQTGSHQLERTGVMPNQGPSAEKIQQWVQDEVGELPESTFEDRIEAFLRAYVNSQGGLAYGLQLDRARAAGDAEKHRVESAIKNIKDLMALVLKMRQMWRVAVCGQLWERADSFYPEGRPLSPESQAVGDWLRLRAEQVVSETERKIVRLVNRFLTNNWNLGKAGGEARPRLYAAINTAAWASLWQLMLLYDQSSTSADQNEDAFLAGHSSHSKRREFDEQTRELFRCLVIVQTELFRTSWAFKSLKKASLEAFGGDFVLYGAFQEAWNSRADFYRERAANVLAVGDFLQSHLHPKEEEVEARRGRFVSAAKKSGNVSPQAG